jgi:nucleotide-binding universal stress UspA family protein
VTTVVLGYVPKPEGEAALAAAIAEAKLRNGRLVVINAHRHRLGFGKSISEEELTAELDEVRERVVAEGVEVDVRHTESDLEPADDLISIAEKENADMIVIGLRRRTPVGKLILGSSAQRILLDAACPVLCVKSE